jgi:hypothetical protein
VQVFLAFLRPQIPSDARPSQLHQIADVECVDLHSLIVTSGGKTSSIWAESNAPYGSLVCPQTE